MLYYIETGHGCCIERARRADQAEREVLREVGTDVGVRLVRKATQRDIDWVSGMGGSVPKDYDRKASPRAGIQS